MEKRDLLYIAIILILLGVVGYFLTQYASNTTVIERENEGIMPVEPNNGIGDGAEPLEEESMREARTEIGESVEGNPIAAYHFGQGENEVLIVGGIHGGYSWNTSLLAYELVDYLDTHPKMIPESVTVTVIPSLNPDGLKNTVGSYGRFEAEDALLLGERERIAGRFNANSVDLNRNFDCDWEAEGVWRNQAVSGGDEAFSEPEAAALLSYVDDYTPVAAIVLFGAEGKVYPSACGGAPSSESRSLASTYAKAANYPTESEFDAYAITGDVVNWLAKENIPAISVLLSTHTDTEFEKNLAGLEAVLETYNE